MKVKDTKTGQVWTLDPTDDTTVVKTRDGHKVKLHPQAIRSMVGVGQRFLGHTLTGTREMERLKEIR